MRRTGLPATIRTLLVAAMTGTAAGARANAPPAVVADPAEVAERAIDAERAAYAAPDATTTRQLASAERLLEIRRQLMRDRPDDPRRAEWLCDQALDVLTLVLPVERAGLTSLFGVPSQQHRQRARDAAGEIYRLAGEAAIEVRRAVATIESGPGYATDFAAQDTRRRLIANERGRWIPLLRGVGAYLHAALSPRLDGRRALYEESIELLRPLMEDPSPWIAAKAQLYAGLAHVGAEQFETATELLRDVATLPGAGRGDVFASRMGQVSVAQGLDPQLAQLDAVEHEYGATDQLRILIADRRFLVLSKAARDASGDRRTALRRRAFEAYTALLAEDPRPHDARRTVLQRLRRVVDTGTPLESLPEIVCIARATQLARDDSTRPEAIALLQGLLERAGHDSPERPEALFELARTLYDAGRAWPAYEQFSRLAREHPGSVRAEPAAEAAVAIADWLFRSTPDDPLRRAALHESLALLLARTPAPATADRWRYVAGCLALDDRRYPDATRHFEGLAAGSPWWADAQFGLAEIMCLRARSAHDDTSPGDAYRRFLDGAARIETALAHAVTGAAGPRAVELGTLLTRLAILRAEAWLALDEPRRALGELQPIGDDNPLAAAAITRRIEAHGALGRKTSDERELQRVVAAAGDQAGPVLVGLIRFRRPFIDALLEQGDGDEALARAESELVGPAAALDRWLETTGADAGSHAAWYVEAAEGYRLAARWAEALRLYERLLDSTPNLTVALFGRAECLYGMGDRDAEAMKLYITVSRLTVDRRDEHYWCSHLRMLEIRSRSGRDTSTITPYIERLRRVDPELGGEQFRRDFDRLQP